MQYVCFWTPIAHSPKRKEEIENKIVPQIDLKVVPLIPEIVPEIVHKNTVTFANIWSHIKATGCSMKSSAFLRRAQKFEKISHLF